MSMQVNPAALEHVCGFERVAIQTFKSLQHVTVMNCGIVVSLERPYLAYCLGGLLGNDGVDEMFI